MSEATQIASMGITTMIELMQARDEIKRLQNIIAEAEKQEPVGWLDSNDIHAEFMHKYLRAEHEKRGSYTPNVFDIPVYLHPQTKCRPSDYEPLSLEQLRKHWQVARVLDMTDAEIDFADYVLIARDVEALHGIKGEA